MKYFFAVQLSCEEIKQTFSNLYSPLTKICAYYVLTKLKIYKVCRLTKITLSVKRIHSNFLI